MSVLFKLLTFYLFSDFWVTLYCITICGWNKIGRWEQVALVTKLLVVALATICAWLAIPRKYSDIGKYFENFATIFIQYCANIYFLVVRLGKRKTYTHVILKDLHWILKFTKKTKTQQKLTINPEKRIPVLNSLNMFDRNFIVISDEFLRRPFSEDKKRELGGARETTSNSTSFDYLFNYHVAYLSERPCNYFRKIRFIQKELDKDNEIMKVYLPKRYTVGERPD